MVDFSKLKKGRLGLPPEPGEVANLSLPEPPADPTLYIRRDGRSARKTNRILPLCVRLSPEFDQKLRDIAEKENLLLTEVIELALEALTEKMEKQR